MPNLLRHNRKKVFIVEDHPVFCDGLVTLFNSDPLLHVCGTARTATRALRGVARLQPDILLVDLGLPGGNGFGLIAEASRRHANLPILVLSMADEMTHAREALHAGASGYLMKTEAPERLLAGVHQVLAGETCVSTMLGRQLLECVRTARRSTEPIERLSPREREILRLIGNGKSAAEIAEELAISRKTVNSYREYMKQKLGISSGPELVRYAVLTQIADEAVHQQKPDLERRSPEP